MMRADDGQRRRPRAPSSSVNIATCHRAAPLALCRHETGAAQSRALTLASLNLRWSLHTAGGDIRLRPILAQLDADVVLLQEVWQPYGGEDTLQPAHELGYAVAELPLSRMGVRATRGFSEDAAAAEGSWGLAVLSRLPLLSCSAVPLGAAAGDPSGARSALRVRLAGDDGSSHEIVNVHLSHRPLRSMVQLMRLVGALGGAPAPLAIGGDFNCLGLVSRAALRRLVATASAPSWPAVRPLLGLDRIYVAPGVDILASRVCADVGSDHRPIWTVLRISARR